MSQESMSRADAIKWIAISGLGLSFPYAYSYPTGKTDAKIPMKDTINQSACRWCYRDISLEDLCAAGKDMGLKSIELLGPEEWEVAIKYGLTCAMSNGSSMGIPNGFNDPANHEQLQKEFIDLIPQAVDHGLERIICFSGNRNGMSDEIGLKNCVEGLKPVMEVAEKHNIFIVMELLNSKVNHPDYQCDHTEWGVALCDALGSDKFKLLYDIYHMQIMEGDIIATINKYHSYIAHYHTGGVPGRNEINSSQELNYPAIMKAILETGYTGYVGQEFIPTGDKPLDSLKEGVAICNV